MDLEKLVSEKWFLDYYPEWVGHSDDDDVRNARRWAMKTLLSAMFDNDGQLTSNVSESIKRCLSKWELDVHSFERDCDSAGEELCTEEFLTELGVIYLARWFITQDLKEFKVLREWSVVDCIRVYANDKKDALNRARYVHRPSINTYGDASDVQVELVEQPDDVSAQ